jgi:ABC-2 type transport system permease protein
MLTHGLRGSSARAVGIVVALVVAIVGLIVTLAAASRASSLDVATLGRVISVGGAEVALAALLLPAMLSRTALLPPRAFLGYGIRSSPLTGMLLLVTLLGPAILLVPLVVLPVVAWHSVPRAAGLAGEAAPLLLVQLLLLLRIGVAAGSWLTRHRAARLWVRVGGALVLLAGLAILTGVVLPNVAGRLAASLSHGVPVTTVERIADAVAGSPIAALWGGPSFAATGVGSPQLAMLIGAESIVLLAAVWRVSVGVALRPTRRLPRARGGQVPGWFRWMPPTPAGAIAARSFIYWLRDPRYRVVFGILPVVPVLTVLAFWVGGVPVSIGSFVPLAAMVLVVAWATVHNDIAYDSTAVWTHVVAQTRGVHDRLGRIWPVLLFGVVLIVVGTPFAVWAQGTLESLPAMLGIEVALLLGGIGVGSAMSPRYPYPAPRPGDSGFTYPQASGGTGGGAQAASFFLTVLVAVPAVAATALWLLGVPDLNWVALGVGLAAGALVLVFGIRNGGEVFDRRGPELLAFTMQN